MSKISNIAAGLAVVPMLAVTGTVFADSPGQLAGGNNIYVVKNSTQNGSYGSTAPVTACGDVIRFSVELSNTEFGKLSDIVVKASVPTMANSTSHMTALPSSGGTTGTQGDVTVTGLTSSESLSYVSGSTQLYNGSGALVSTLNDNITTSGVNVGDLNGSTKEFVNFNAKVTCDTPPVVKHIKVCELSTKKVITIDEKDFNTSKYTKDLSKCVDTPTPPTTPGVQPTTLVNTGAGNVAAIFAGVSAVAGIGYAWVMRRQNAR